jgi:ABC-type nitrate/sulfonate/bicarbonate transport system permease component
MNRIFTIRVCTLVVIAAAWEALGRSGLVYNDVVPPLTSIAAAIGSELASAKFYHHLAVTCMEVAIGFSIASILGIALGLTFGIRRYLGRAVEPYVAALATTPKIVFLPIVMIAVGIGFGSKIALGALSALFPVVISTTAGVRGVPAVLVRVGHVFNLSTAQMIGKVYLPALIGPIVTGLRLGLGVAIVGVLLGEIKLSNAGLGFLANDYYNQFRIAELYSVIAIVFALAAMANAVMSRIESRARR